MSLQLVVLGVVTFMGKTWKSRLTRNDQEKPEIIQEDRDLFGQEKLPLQQRINARVRVREGYDW
jgi:hypothetical protein